MEDLLPPEKQLEYYKKCIDEHIAEIENQEALEIKLINDIDFFEFTLSGLSVCYEEILRLQKILPNEPEIYPEREIHNKLGAIQDIKLDLKLFYSQKPEKRAEYAQVLLDIINIK